jgi:hypothetical protein
MCSVVYICVLNDVSDFDCANYLSKLHLLRNQYVITASCKIPIYKKGMLQCSKKNTSVIMFNLIHIYIYIY